MAKRNDLVSGIVIRLMKKQIKLDAKAEANRKLIQRLKTNTNQK